MAITIQFEMDESALLGNIPTGEVSARVVSNARTPTGIPIMKLVDLGRGVVRPRRAKVLRIPMRGVRFIPAEGGTKAVLFRTRARPAQPQLVTDRAILQTETAASILARTGDFDLSSRPGAVRLVNSIARLLANNMKSLIRSKSGRLSGSIKVEEAI